MHWRERASNVLWKFKWSLRPANRPNEHRVESLRDELRNEGAGQGRRAASRWFEENVTTNEEATKFAYALGLAERPPDRRLPEGALISYGDDSEIRRSLPPCPVSARIEHEDEGIWGEGEFVRILRRLGVPYYASNSFWGDRLHWSLAEAFQDGWDTALEAELTRLGRENIQTPDRA